MIPQRLGTILIQPEQFALLGQMFQGPSSKTTNSISNIFPITALPFKYYYIFN